MGRNSLVANLVIAGFATRFAVVQTILPQADVQLSLTEDAVLFAFTPFFGLLALTATSLRLGGHRRNCTAFL